VIPEFFRPERLDTIGAGERSVAIEANEGERAALAVRFGLKALDRLAADFAIRREAAGVIVRGHVSAAVVQACVVTDEPVPDRIEEDVALRFVAEGAPEADELELGEDAVDTVFFSGSAIDLGEAAAETMALALNPYPRAPGATEALRAAGVISEEEAGPFGALAGLKGKLGGDA
jgi:uncharacterized metal-binding protein YceD (DUF177 family)